MCGPIIGSLRGYAMSPVPAADQAQRTDRKVPPAPYPAADLFLAFAKEMVVDWQLPSDMERTN